MLLLIDAGNTRIKWALVEAGSAVGGWLASGAVTHAQLDTLARNGRNSPSAKRCCRTCGQRHRHAPARHAAGSTL